MCKGENHLKGDLKVITRRTTYTPTERYLAGVQSLSLTLTKDRRMCTVASYNLYCGWQGNVAFAPIWVLNVSFNIYNTKRFVSSSNSKPGLVTILNRFLVTFDPLCAAFLHVRSYISTAAFTQKLISLGQATTQSYHSVHSHRTLDSSYFNICPSQKALRTKCWRFRDSRKWLGRDSAQWTHKPYECLSRKKTLSSYIDKRKI